MKPLLTLFALLLTTTPLIAAPPARPNIVWIIVEDMSANFSCYGEKTIQTPNVDQLAAQGIKFTNAVVTAPVCSAARSALIAGTYQTTIGAHNHRSGRGKIHIILPEDVTLVPTLFQQAGYLVNNLSVSDFLRTDAQVKKNSTVKSAKTDYNFDHDDSLYDTTHWTQRQPNQPFFVQIQCHGGKYRGIGNGPKWPATAKKTLGSNVSPDDVTLQPYLADDPVIREDWAQYLDTVRYTDHEVGQIVARLKETGNENNTLLFFITDHGISHVRHKQFLYEGGIHIPLIIRGPGIKAGDVRTDVVEHIDLAATSLAAAGIDIPDFMFSRNILADNYQPREFAFSARDRCDETIDHIRSVRSTDFKYIRNFLPNRPYLQPNAYKDHKPIQITMRKLHAEGKLNATQELFMAQTRPEEELYDLKADPFEINNLAQDSAYNAQLLTMRSALENWMETTQDQGRTPESMQQYDSDMNVYTKGRANKTDEESNSNETIRNIQLMKQWAQEGK